MLERNRSWGGGCTTHLHLLVFNSGPPKAAVSRKCCSLICAAQMNENSHSSRAWTDCILDCIEPHWRPAVALAPDTLHLRFYSDSLRKAIMRRSWTLLLWGWALALALAAACPGGPAASGSSPEQDLLDWIAARGGTASPAPGRRTAAMEQGAA